MKIDFIMKVVRLLKVFEPISFSISILRVSKIVDHVISFGSTGISHWVPNQGCTAAEQLIQGFSQLNITSILWVNACKFMMNDFFCPIVT